MKRKEILVGLLVAIAAVLLFALVNFLKGVNVFKSSNYYYSSYSNVEGLSVSAPITVNGFKVGVVRSIDYQYNNPGNVVVEMDIDKNLKLPVNTSAEIVAGLLGTATIELHAGNAADGYYHVGDTIPGTMNSGLLGSVSETLMPAVSAIFPKVDTLLTNLNALVSDPALTASVQRMDNITAELSASATSLRQLMASMQPVMQNVSNITSNVDTITTDLAAVSGVLREAPLDSLIDELNRTAANLEQLTTALNNPDSSVGRLTSDPELYNNINSTVQSLDSLFIDIRQHPKRYINIKLL